MKQILGVRSVVASILCLALSSPGIVMAQEPAPKYKLTIVEDASTSKRVKKGRVSSQAVVKVTDQNNLPVPAIAITFLIPQGTGGAAFASGGLTSIGTTNAAGIASSGTFSTTAGSSFNMSASAAVPGGNITLPIPISTTAVAAAAGISTDSWWGSSPALPRPQPPGSWWRPGVETAAAPVAPPCRRERLARPVFPTSGIPKSFRRRVPVSYFSNLRRVFVPWIFLAQGPEFSPRVLLRAGLQRLSPDCWRIRN